MPPKPLWNLAALLMLGAISYGVAAASVTGTIINKTSGIALAGAEVTMVRVDHGPYSELHTVADAQGRFSFNTSIDVKSHGIVSVRHGDVSYSQVATSSNEVLQIDVYDSVPQLKEIAESVDDLVVQTKDNILQITEIFMVKNESRPARTLVSSVPFAFYLPPGAHIAMAAVASPGQLPFQSTPKAMDDNGKFGFNVPLLPGLTQFEVIYQLPYNGQIDLTPRPARRVNHFAVMFPTDMKFFSDAPGVYTQQARQQGGMRVQLATHVLPGSNLRFQLSGTEVAVLPRQAPASQAEVAVQPAKIQTTLALQRFNPGWLGLAVVCAAFLLACSLSFARGGPTTAHATPALHRGRASVTDRESFKDRLFDIETQWLQGTISRQMYDAARAELEPSLQSIGTVAETRSLQEMQHR